MKMPMCWRAPIISSMRRPTWLAASPRSKRFSACAHRRAERIPAAGPAPIATTSPALSSVSGDRLFVGETDFSTLEKVRNVDIPRPRQVNPAIPEAVENIIMKALAKDAAEKEKYEAASTTDKDKMIPKVTGKDGLKMAGVINQDD